MDISNHGIIHSIETGSAVDGPGLRFVVFMAGCPFRCLYCHNPDTWNANAGQQKTVREITAEIEQYRDYLQNTKGGVTVSGGEPLVQEKFVTRLLQACKKMNLHTALDTNGFRGDNVSADLLDATDLVLLDIKSFDPETHERLTGQPLQPTLDFARKLSALRKPTWIRFVLVPGLTDDDRMIAALADFVKTLGCVERVEVLPFHKMGEEKWKKLSLPYTLASTDPPNQEMIERTKSVFRTRGLTVV